MALALIPSRPPPLHEASLGQAGWKVLERAYVSVLRLEQVQVWVLHGQGVSCEEEVLFVPEEGGEVQNSVYATVVSWRDPIQQILHWPALCHPGEACQLTLEGTVGAVMWVGVSCSKSLRL